MERFDLLINNFNSLSKELLIIGQQLKSESEEFFNTIVEYSPNFIAIVQNGKFVFVNAFGIQLLKCKSSSDIIGKDFIEIIHQDNRDIVLQCFSNPKTGLNKPIRLKAFGLDGAQFDLESSIIPFLYNKKTAVLIISRDITSELQQREVLQKEQQLRNDILDAFKEVIAFYDSRHKVKWINRAGMEQLGYTDNSYVGKSCYKIWFGNKGPCPHCPVVTKNTKPSERLVTFSDQSIWMVRHIPMLDPENHVTGYIEFRENVTEKEKIKQELEKSRIRLVKAEKTANFGHFEYDLVKKTGILSHGVYHILGMPDEDIKQHPFEHLVKFIHSDDFSRVAQHFSRTVTGNSKFNQVFRAYDVSGNLKIIQGKGELIEDTEKGARLFFGTIQDITREREMEKKNKQLAADSLYVTQKNKILQEIENELNHVLSSKKTFQKKDFQKIIDVIGSYGKLDKDWDLLKSHFEEIHASFFHKLKEAHPSLSSNDLKHCACIKLNFSTKEIARFFNVKVTSVQISRVRLKKKMDLDESVELRNYIMAF
jgi:PAS domain S-box-containing protein